MAGECEESYGFLPCSNSLGGSISLMVVYGYLLLQGASSLSNGSELLLEILDPGVIGGLLLPVLGALPDSLIILVSGLGVARSEAQEQVAVGVGTLAGSTIMLLTIAWGGSLLVGRCDLGSNGRAKEHTLTRGWAQLAKTGVTTDQFTPTNAGIMIATAALYAIIQVPAFLGHTHDPTAALIGAIACFATFIAYSAYQMVFPELQRRKMERARLRRLRMHAVREVALRSAQFGLLVLPSGEVDRGVVDKLFDSLDTNHNGRVDDQELRALLTGLALSGPSAKEDVAALERSISYWMREFDEDHDGQVDKHEFYKVITKWVSEKTRTARGADGAPHSNSMAALRATVSPLNSPDASEDEDEGDVEAGAGEGVNSPLVGAPSEAAPASEEGSEKELTRGQVLGRALALLALGTAACAVFSDPMVEAVTAFSKASGIKPFFVAFCAVPFASNASELVSSLQFAARKRQKNISLTFSQVYGAATMNNTLVLGLFLAVCWYQDLTWTFTSEVLVTVGITVLVGALGISRRTFSSLWAVPVLALFPLAIAAVYIGDNILKLDGEP